MKHLIFADFSNMHQTDLERMFIAAAIDETTDRMVAFGPIGSIEIAEWLFEKFLEARRNGNQGGVVILPSGNDDREILLELKVRYGGDPQVSQAIDEIVRATDKIRSLPLDTVTFGAKPRICYMSYEGFEFMTGVQKFAQVKELIQTSNFAPHAFLSIIRPLYLSYQDLSNIWVVQPVPETQTEYLHHRRLYVFKGVRTETDHGGKVLTLNQREHDLGICHSCDILLQEPGGKYQMTHNHDRAYERILSFISPSQESLAGVSQGRIHCNLLAPGYSHQLTLGRANQGHFTLIFTRHQRVRDLLIEHGLPASEKSGDMVCPGVAYFNMDLARRAAR